MTGRTRAVLILATILAIVATSTAMAALSGSRSTPAKGRSQVIFSQGSLDANPMGGTTFELRFGRERGQGQAADNCVVHERQQPRGFRRSPFGLPTRAGLRIYLTDERRPASIAVRRWAVDPNLHPDSKAELLPVRRPVAARFEGRVSFWVAQVQVPIGEPSWLVARVAWPDPDDCAAGNDFLATGIALTPLED